ncbi:MAG: caspase family protein [Sandaracinaceae bacterium]|nr:caspase family protein [Sandaracinaceae bacterium]
MKLKLCLIALLGAVSVGCSGSGGSPTGAPAQQPGQAARPLFEQDGQLAPGGHVNLNVPVEAGEQVVVTLTATEFDPILEVTPPGAAPLTNDDWRGSRTESRLSVIVSEGGTLKVGVTSFSPATGGSFHVRVDRGGLPVVAEAAPGVTAVPTGGATPSLPSGIASQMAVAPATLQPGQTYQGEIGNGDSTLADGSRQEQVLVSGATSGPLSLFIQAQTQVIPSAVVLDPQGRALSAASNGSYTITQPGTHRVQLIAAANQTAGYTMRLSAAAAAPAAAPTTPQLSRTHHQLPTGGTPQSVTIGQRVSGQLNGSSALPTGEPMTLYSFNATPGQSITVDLTSTAFDPYLMVIGPTGRHWENDDAGGGLNSQVVFDADAAGTYRVVATAYRAGMAGAFDLGITLGQRGTTPAAPTPGVPSTVGVATGPGTSQRGALAQGDATLNSGEFMDTYEMNFPAGTAVHLEAVSTGFDTYLMVRPPSGEQLDNDDQASGNTNAALNFVSTGGSYRVMVTSYRPGEVGDYELRVNQGGAAPATSPTTNPGTEVGHTGGPGARPATAVSGTTATGALAQGDATIQSGEFADYFTRTFEVGQSVEIRLTSSQFDPYIIVMSPSGRQLDNDDINGQTRDAGINLPAAEAGEYRITVTSYRPGEVGNYNLTFGAGAAVPRPSTGTGTAANGQGGRIFGVFVGISDYPGSGSDLPECANDAIKLAQALREHSLLVETRQVVLTDSQATLANVRQAMQRMATEVRPDDIFVFFYSGHGSQGSPGSTDAREIDGIDESIVLFDGQMVDDEMGRLFDGINARLAVLSLDSCFAGGFAKDVITRPGRVGLFSSEEDVLSAVAGQFQAGGYLSHFLRTAFQGSADAAPNDGVLTVGELTHYLHRQFAQHAADVEMQGAYQHLVVDRGAVTVDQVLWSYR